MNVCCCARGVRAVVWMCGFLCLTACAGGGAGNGEAGSRSLLAGAGVEAAALSAASPSSPSEFPLKARDADWFDRLERLAEKERSSGFEAGAGLRESALREEGRDYAGAVFAAFKELFWAYSFAEGEEGQRSVESMIEAGFRGLAENLGQMLDAESARVAGQAAEACILFFEGRYAEAGGLIAGIERGDTEPDEFSAWLGLVCALESAGKGERLDVLSGVPSAPGALDTPDIKESVLRQLRASYAAIRSRYETLPAYWYFGARNMKGETIPAYAERAINLSPEGPYAADSRVMIAEFSGLSQADGAAIKTMYEIETVVVNAVKTGNPELLSALFPLAALPDNPYTLYAAGALRGLVPDSRFKNYFDTCLRAIKQMPDKSQGRLAERLAYIARG